MVLTVRVTVGTRGWSEALSEGRPDPLLNPREEETSPWVPKPNWEALEPL